MDGAVQREFLSFFVVFVTFVVSSLENAGQENEMLGLCGTEVGRQR
jgi:hypothetical protein